MSFDVIKHLLFEKRKPELDPELLEGFSPYLTAKTLSFLDGGAFAQYTNETLNTYYNIFESKEDNFRFFEALIPKGKKRKLDYIKKPKVEKTEKFPIPEFYSQREIDFLEKHCK